MTKKGAWPWGLAAALLCLLSLAARWPGIVMYDTVSQWGQVVDDAYTDWHPPVMARTWGLLGHLYPGTQPLFVGQMLLWWGGLGLLAGALAQRRRRIAAALVLAVGAMPLFLDWATTILKDAQMASCLLAATGLVAHWRLRERRVPLLAKAAALVLIGYATLVRGNAVFATVPFALALFDWPGLRRPWARVVAVGAGALLVIGVSPFINHRLLGAEATHVERTLPLYDMAGIAHFAKLPTLPGLPPARWAQAERQGCYSPYFWNPYGEPAQCDDVGQAVAMGDDAPPHLTAHWLALIATHPLAYAMHRLAHLNSTLRFWVGPGEGDAVSSAGSEHNDLGLGGPARVPGAAVVAAARMQAASPLGWPCVGLAVALALLWAARGQAPQVRIGRALALSAACMAASFAVVSIASDWRYHLWSMVAAALATVLILDARALRPRRARVGGLGVALVAALATAAHLGLAPSSKPPLPATKPAPSSRA
jgi:hypothetical protein